MLGHLTVLAVPPLFAGRFWGYFPLMPNQTGQTWTLWIASAALVLSFFNFVKDLWKDRTRLDLTVDWDWQDWAFGPPAPEQEDNGVRGPELRITIANLGGRSVYIDEIVLSVRHRPNLRHRLSRLVHPNRFQSKDEVFYPLGRPSDPLIPPGANLHYVPFIPLSDDEGQLIPGCLGRWSSVTIGVGEDVASSFDRSGVRSGAPHSQSRNRAGLWSHRRVHLLRG